MEEQSTIPCIVCLGDLRELATPNNENEPADPQAGAREHADDAGSQHHKLRDTRLSAKRYQYHLLIMLQAADRLYT